MTIQKALIRAAKESGNSVNFLLMGGISNLLLSGVVRGESDYGSINEIFSNQKFITKFMSNIQEV